MIKAGATLHPESGPKRNPRASMVSRTEPYKVAGFYAINGWLAGGFCRGSVFFFQSCKNTSHDRVARHYQKKCILNKNVGIRR